MEVPSSSMQIEAEQEGSPGAVRRWARNARVLQELTAALGGTLTREEVVVALVDHGMSTLGARTVLIVLGTADHASLEVAGSRGHPPGVAEPGTRLQLRAGDPIAEALRSAEPYWVERQDADVAHDREPSESPVMPGGGWTVALPLTDADGAVFGALAFHFGPSTELDAQERGLLETIGRQGAQALERARLFSAERAARAESEAARLVAERARREADEANQAKAAFLATMSHEIRTPINAILGYSQLMELGIAGPVTEEQRDYLARLMATSEHLRGLVDDVLDLSKIEAEQMAVARRPAMTGPLVAASLDLVRPQASARAVRLVDARSGDPGEGFVGDEHRVRQILANLLSNAVKFTDAGGTVSVDCGRFDHTPPAAALQGDGPWTFVRVRDTGIGIAPEEQTKIFEPFHQVDRGHTRQRGGTGLGLAISRRLARLMGGDLTLESAPGVGSTFTLWLPAAASLEDGLESAAARGARARQELSSHRTHGLGEVGWLVRNSIEDIVTAYATRLRADPVLPQSAGLLRTELEDHQLSFLADLAQTLMMIEETGGPDSDLLRDGSTIQRVIAELHGAMRERRDFTEEQLAHEYEILLEEITAAVRRRVPEQAGDASFALGILERLVMRARELGLAAFRRAREARPDGGRGAASAYAPRESPGDAANGGAPA